MPHTILSPLKAAKVSSTIVAAHNKDKEAASTKRTSRTTTAMTKRYVTQFHAVVWVVFNAFFIYIHTVII